MRDGGAEMNGDEFFTAGDNLKLYFQRSNPEDNYFGYVTRQSVGYFATTAHRAIGPHDIINPTGTTNAGAGNTIYFTSGSNYYKGITLSNEGEVNIPSGSISASYFVGDGSQLTGIDPFPFSGSAVITGSLEVSGSFQIKGVSEGTVLDINGDTGVFAIGTGATNTSNTNVVIGSGSSAGSVYGVIIGQGANTTSTESYATVIGNGAFSNGARS